MTSRIGYEKQRVDFDFMPRGQDGEIKPSEFWAYRVKNGRYVDRGGPFADEASADAWIDSQRELDADDKFRETGRWTK